MRALIIALVCLIVLVAGGTAALIALKVFGPAASAQATTPLEPSRTNPTTRPPVSPRPTEVDRAATPPTANAPPSPFAPPETVAPPPAASDPNAKAEVLPPRPALSAKSKFTAFDKKDLLFLETAEDGTRRVLVVAEVCLRGNVMLEVFCCKKGTKEHEAILSVDMDARNIHTALLAAGAEPGKPVQFVNQKTLEEEYIPASGQRIGVEVTYLKGGAAATDRAQEWVIDQRTKKPMAYEWVFAGSRLVRDPDRPTAPPFYTANSGEVIAISNFLDSMLDVPVEVSQSNNDLHFRAAAGKVPPQGSKVWVILTPLPDPAKKGGK